MPEIRTTKYKMSSSPVLPSSMSRYLRDELEKIQKTLDSILRAIEELDDRTTP